MATDPRRPEFPRQRTCGAYRYGHDMHFIQARLSLEDGPGVTARIASVADDGTITFTDGTRLWNHDPERLRADRPLWHRPWCSARTACCASPRRRCVLLQRQRRARSVPTRDRRGTPGRVDRRRAAPPRRRAAQRPFGAGRA